MSAVIERTYAARCIEAGLYVQRSNDGDRRFVIARFEDGRAHGLDHGPERYTFWSWGELPLDEAREIERTAAYDADSALADLRDIAAGGVSLRTKREAIMDAIRYARDSVAA